MNKIAMAFVWLLLIMSVSVLIIGIFETVRNEFLFTITEENIMNSDNVPDNILEYYYNFKNEYIFTNEIFTTLFNFVGTVAIFYIMTYCWMYGRKLPTFTIKEIFDNFGIYLILIIYVAGSVFMYLADVFINQLIVVLFAEIYQALYIYRILVDNFFFFVMFGYGLTYLSNVIKNFKILS